MNPTDVLPLVSDPTLELYNERVLKLLEACHSVEEECLQHVQKYHPNPGDITELNNPTTNFAIDDARVILAREHGFENYEHLSAHILGMLDKQSEIYRFEKAADAIVAGDRITLLNIIDSDPAIVHARSSRNHQATLLHYIAANGVEDFRQRTPGNALEIADILLRSGSAPDAQATMYEQSWCTSLELLVSSVHTAKAGLQAALAEKLLDFGAAVNGVLDDCSPLLTSICFCYVEAAEALVRRGARIDNVVSAAALGRLDQVKDFLDQNGKLKSGGNPVQVSWLGPGLSNDATSQLAFVWAAMHNQSNIVAFFIEKGMGTGARDLRQWTALHWAAYYGHSDTVQLLLDSKAPLEARNEFGGTVLDQTLWATIHEGVRPQHPDIINKLIDAGAVIHPWWLFANLRPPLNDKVAALLHDRGHQ